MKKRIIMALIVFTLLAPFVFSGCGSQPETPAGEGFAIYLTKNNVPVPEMEPLSHVEIADTPIIGNKDIVAYYWEKHEIQLTAEAYKRLEDFKVPMWGTSFVVCVDRQPVYWGAFWSMLSSQFFPGIVIWVHPLLPLETLSNSIGIRGARPPDNAPPVEDLRESPVIKASLKAAGKLK